MQMNDEMVQIDAHWVRKWKRLPDKSLKVKSRLCARGCLDQQKSLLTTCSATATRLLQRILVSTVCAQEEAQEEEDRELGHRWSVLERFRLQSHPEGFAETWGFSTHQTSGGVSTDERMEASSITGS